jgi:hypothetical protein
VRWRAPDGSAITLGLQSHLAEAGASLGLRFHGGGGAALGLRLGAVLLVDIIDLAAGAPALPSDRVLGATAAVSLVVPRVFEVGGRAIGVRLGAGAMAPAWLTQNIQDGLDTTTWGAGASGGVSIAMLRDPSRGQLLGRARLPDHRGTGARRGKAGPLRHAAGRLP